MGVQGQVSQVFELDSTLILIYLHVDLPVYVEDKGHGVITVIHDV